MPRRPKCVEGGEEAVPTRNIAWAVGRSFALLRSHTRPAAPHSTERYWTKRGCPRTDSLPGELHAGFLSDDTIMSPTSADLMLAAGGVAFGSAADGPTPKRRST